MTSYREQLYDGRLVPKDRMYQLQPEALALLGRLSAGNPHRQLLEWLMQYAQIKRADAGYGGEMNSDYGARALEEQVEVFIAAMQGSLPSVWDRYIKIRAKDHDPEYAKYLELKSKFE
jgi:hypothetical protein